jgi:hypothetical protein
MNAAKLMAACALAVLTSACSQTQTRMTADNVTAKIVVIQSGA